jgi:hypothetical protein
VTILADVKSAVGVQDASFDFELLGYINQAISSLDQLGVDSFDAYGEIDEASEWPDESVDGLSPRAIALYKGVVIGKTSLSFDPPANAAILSAKRDSLRELEARLNYYTEEEGA